MPNAPVDSEILRAALIGYQSQLGSLDEKIAAIRARVHSAEGHSVASTAQPSTKRVLSAAARRRIAVAQKKRWAAVRAQGKGVVKAVPPAKKSRISPEARKRIIAAAKKRWAEYRAKKAAAAKP